MAEARGGQVQINLYADCLEITNPGGLFGGVTVDTLGMPGFPRQEISSCPSSYQALPTHPIFTGRAMSLRTRGRDTLR